MTFEVHCPACGHAQTAEGDAAIAFDDIGLFSCPNCSARAVYGKLSPRVVVEPFVDERGHRWIRRRFQDPITKKDVYVVDVDPIFAVAEFKSVLSLVQT